MNYLRIPGTIQPLIITLFISILALFICLPISHAALSANDMQNPTLVTNEGFNYISRGGQQNLDKAEEYFRKALNLDPYYADAYVGLGKLNMMRNMHYNDYVKDRCKQSLTLFDRAISYDKKCIRGHFNRGLALVCLEDYDAALAASELLDGQNFPYYECGAHLIRAKAYKGKFLMNKSNSDKKMAIVETTDYTECAQSDPTSGQLASAFDLLREITRTTKDFDSTEKYFKRNIELKPHSMWSYENYYRMILLRTDEGYFKDTDIDEAAKTVKEGKEKTGMVIGSVCELFGHRGSFYFKRKQYDHALAEYGRCLAVEPGHTATTATISFMCSKITDDRCTKFWQKIIGSYLERGDCKNATKEFQVQYAKHPDDFEPVKKAVMQCKEKNH